MRRRLISRGGLGVGDGMWGCWLRAGGESIRARVKVRMGSWKFRSVEKVSANVKNKCPDCTKEKGAIGESLISFIAIA